MRAPVEYAVVVPTIGRPCLADCLRALAASAGQRPAEVVVVDDRPAAVGGLPVGTAGDLPVRVLATGGRGPAAARNAGARTVGAPWVVFLDDDVQVLPDWAERLAEDLAEADERTAGVQGRLRVPLPDNRKPTDWERGTAGLEAAAWATADMAYRATALKEVGGFDERFRRAFREDADLALRMMDAGWVLRRGRRVTRHPVRPSGPWASVRAQRGNADDVLMNRLHGRDWWARGEAPRGRLPGHLATTGLACVAVVGTATGRRRGAALAAALWVAATAEFAWARIAPGPRTCREAAVMAATSVVIPPFAVWHWLAGQIEHRGVRSLGDDR
ncbi:glycosyltransferase family 2 protein [Streptomyces atroolivaceus]|uniref:glycosyltransferase family 2 protein n=1 Tax=Streptomyces atroolivaceus TaxID=66869 RepID=UPI00378DA92E